MVWFVFDGVKQEIEFLPGGTVLPVYLLDKMMNDISLWLSFEDATYPNGMSHLQKFMNCF